MDNFTVQSCYCLSYVLVTLCKQVEVDQEEVLVEMASGVFSRIPDFIAIETF
jgi:hypothetical protein